ncbi:hypothetical protein MRX96_021714 [Rhipicephalus microplus]
MFPTVVAPESQKRCHGAPFPADAAEAKESRSRIAASPSNMVSRRVDQNRTMAFHTRLTTTHGASVETKERPAVVGRNERSSTRASSFALTADSADRRSHIAARFARLPKRVAYPCRHNIASREKDRAGYRRLLPKLSVSEITRSIGSHVGEPFGTFALICGRHFAASLVILLGLDVYSRSLRAAEGYSSPLFLSVTTVALPRERPCPPSSFYRGLWINQVFARV